VTASADGSFPLASAAELDAAAGTVDRWVTALAEAGPPVLAAGRDDDPHRWYVRLRGADKDVLTVWFHLRQRTLTHEAQVMPAPETAPEQVFAYVLRRNRHLPQLRFALGPEDALYLVGELPVGQVDPSALDRVIGGTLATVDDCYATAMSLGFAGWYRRRPRRR
jgi:hypothetical protein